MVIVVIIVIIIGVAIAFNNDYKKDEVVFQQNRRAGTQEAEHILEQMKADGNIRNRANIYCHATYRTVYNAEQSEIRDAYDRQTAFVFGNLTHNIQSLPVISTCIEDIQECTLEELFEETVYMVESYKELLRPYKEEAIRSMYKTEY